MRVRRVERADLEELTALFEDHAAYENLSFEGHGRRRELERLIFGKPPRIFGWIAEYGGEVAGYMTATIDHSTWNAAPFVYMDCLYLRGEFRGRGLGWGLMRELAAFARQRGCREMQWHTPPDNALGIGFYRRIGARELPKTRFFLDSGSEAGRGRAP